MRRQVLFLTALAAFLGAALPVAAAGGPGEPAHDRPHPAFRRVRLRPAAAGAGAPSGWDRSLTAGPDLQLVQFDGPIPADAAARLHAAGLAPVRYVYPNAYIVWGKGADRDALRGQARIRWAGEFAPAYRVRAALRERSKGVLDVRVLIYRGAGADAVVAALSRLGLPTGGRTVIDDTLEIAGFRIPGSLMRFAAAVPGVYSIQQQNSDWAPRAELSSQINVGNIDPGTGFPVPGYRDWLAAVGLNGAGVNVAIVDEGVDQSHPDLAAGRLPCVGVTCTDAPSVHGSHVAGIVTGDGVSGAQDANGFLRGLGVAPGSRYLEQEFVLFRFLPAGVTQLILDSGRNGATISNNSWGTSTTAEGYDADTLHDRHRRARRRPRAARQPGAVLRPGDRQRERRRQLAGDAGRGEERLRRRLDAGLRRRREPDRDLRRPVLQHRTRAGARRPHDPAPRGPRLPRRLDDPGLRRRIRLPAEVRHLDGGAAGLRRRRALHAALPPPAGHRGRTPARR